MAIKTLLYRGALKSCNYQCSYCLFSISKASQKELTTDQEQFERFCESIKKRAPIQGIEAIMIVPHGEVLLYPYYWEGLARISRLETIQAVGSQTNLSFPITKFLKLFEKAGGHLEKLRLWTTFHPEMVSLSMFLKQCRKLKREGISFSVGTVGVPGNLEIISQLREELPEEIYLWIDRMDGAKHPYSKEELEAFQNIDPFFSQELTRKKADKSQCLNRLFVKGDGKIHLCSLSPPLEGNWYDGYDDLPQPECSQKECSCYLAYAGREDFEHSRYFGDYPLFRILWKPKAFFIDIDGTLLFNDKVNPKVIPWLKKQKEHAPLFLTTSLPYKEAVRLCQNILHLFDGGIFAGGAHVHLKPKGRRKLKEIYSPLNPFILPILKEKQPEYGYRLRVYQNGEIPYKITLEKPYSHTWREDEMDSLKQLLPANTFRFIQTENYLQIISSKTDKGSGMKKLCEWLGISTRDCVAAGNSTEDLPMLRISGYSIAAFKSTAEIQNAATQTGFQTSVPWDAL